LGHVRVGETGRVLEAARRDSRIWWLIVYEEDGGLGYTYVQSSARANLRLLLDALRRLRGRRHLVFAVWHGQYRTDLFLVDPEEVVRGLEAELGGGGG